MSLELARAFGGTGTTRTGADRFGSTTPAIVVGKGFGDLDVPALQPLAVTAMFAATIPDVALRRVASTADVATRLNNGSNGVWSVGFSVQYSLPYLARRTPGLRLPGLLAGLVPICEFAWTSPASAPSAQGTTWIAAPGLLYVRGWGEVAMEGAGAARPGGGRGGRRDRPDRAPARLTTAGTIAMHASPDPRAPVIQRSCPRGARVPTTAGTRRHPSRITMRLSHIAAAAPLAFSLGGRCRARRAGRRPHLRGGHGRVQLRRL